MSENRNYTNYSKVNKPAEPATPETPEIQTVQSNENVQNIQETPEPQPEPKAPEVVTGIVVNCELLNMRKKPDVKSDVVKTLRKGTTVEVNKEKSTQDFYAVPGGFCMKKYIKLNK